MLTRVDIQNYRSIYKASVPLSPFTLLIGANGAGKSNFLRLLKELSLSNPSKENRSKKKDESLLTKHRSFAFEGQYIAVHNDKQQSYIVKNEPRENVDLSTIFPSHLSPLGRFASGQDEPHSFLPELRDVRVFSLDYRVAGNSEYLVANPTIQEDGQGLVQVLDSLKTGDREDLFFQIEKTLKQHIPEVEKLSFVSGNQDKRLQVREKHLPQPVPLSVLSKGMQLALMLITILYQERKPSLICIEEIDSGLHPRLYQSVIQLCFDISQWDDVQIIATTHNPYLIDEFEDNESAVVIVEKDQGQTQFTVLEERLMALEVDEDVPLGSLWYSGLVGGVPKGV